MDAVPSGEALLEVFKWGGRLGCALSPWLLAPGQSADAHSHWNYHPSTGPHPPREFCTKSPHHSQIWWQKAQLRLVVSACFCFPEALLGSSCTTKHTQMWLWPRKWLIPWLLMHSPASSSGSAELTISGLLPSDSSFSRVLAIRAWGSEKEPATLAWLLSFSYQILKSSFTDRKILSPLVFPFSFKWPDAPPEGGQILEDDF